MTMKRPRAILISDVHVSLKTLSSSITALKAAVDCSNDLRVPLAVLGDLHDTKGSMRAECISAMIKTFQTAKTRPLVLVGNHDLINEKGLEHSLEFLRSYADVVDSPRRIRSLNLIPYQTSKDSFLAALFGFPKGSEVLCHQGILGANMGSYFSDHSAITPEEIKEYRLISGHYHRAQTVGTLTYLGSPYTTTFAEADDGDKGFHILYEDGALEFVKLDLPKHVVIQITCPTGGADYASWLSSDNKLRPDDKLWLKVSGAYSDLQKLDKNKIGAALLGHSDFHLDLLPLNTLIQPQKDILPHQLLSAMISESEEAAGQKSYLDALWKEIVR